MSGTRDPAEGLRCSIIDVINGDLVSRRIGRIGGDGIRLWGCADSYRKRRRPVGDYTCMDGASGS